jgi:hypothetical protein
MNWNLVAHAGETHESSIESFSHNLQPWPIAVLFFIIFLLVVGNVVFAFTKKSLYKTLLVLSVILLVGAFFVYENLKVLSVLSLTTSLVFLLLLSMRPKPEALKK